MSILANESVFRSFEHLLPADSYAAKPIYGRTTVDCSVAHFVFLVAVPVETITDGVPEAESELVASFRHKLRYATADEVQQIKELVESRELELVGAGRGSVRLFWWCRTRRSLDCLLVWLDTGRLLTASQQLVNIVSPHRQLVVGYLCIKQYLTKDIDYFPRCSGVFML